MNHSIDKTNFRCGIFIGIIFVIILNIFLPFEKYDYNHLYSIGFPFPFYKEGYVSHTEHLRTIVWLGLIADLIIAIVICLGFGVLLRNLLSKKTQL